MSQDQDLMELAKQQPLTAVEICQDRMALILRSHHEQIYHYIAVAYAIASQLQHDPVAWRSFTEFPFWDFRRKRLRAKDSRKALLHVMVFVFSASSKATYDRVCTYATAIEIYFQDGLPSTRVAAQIKQDGGIESLLKRARACKAHCRQQRHLGTRSHDHRSDNRDSSPERPRESLVSLSTADHTSQISTPSGVSTDYPEALHMLFLTADPTLRRQILDLPPGGQARLTIARASHKREGAARILAFRVQPA